MQEKTQANWEADDLSNLMRLLVGKTYGEDPEQQIGKIIQNKKHEANNIHQYLNLVDTDRVLDLGSGCGFIADNLAPRVQQVYCADISQSFLDHAKKILLHHQNINFCKITHGNLDTVPRVTAIYSTAVFIHFTLYDIYLYLQQCYNKLESPGRMVFDFLNDEYLDIQSDRWQRHVNNYVKDQQAIFTNLHFNNDKTIQLLAQKIGFDIDWIKQDGEHTFVLLRK